MNRSSPVKFIIVPLLLSALTSCSLTTSPRDVTDQQSPSDSGLCDELTTLPTVVVGRTLEADAMVLHVEGDQARQIDVSFIGPDETHVTKYIFGRSGLACVRDERVRTAMPVRIISVKEYKIVGNIVVATATDGRIAEQVDRPKERAVQLIDAAAVYQRLAVRKIRGEQVETPGME